jgi:hypothetical protein
MREMKSAPEKIVVLEVAMVRLVKPDLDASLDALAERVTKLERQERLSATVPTAPVTATPTLRPIGSTGPAPTAAPVAPVAPMATAPPPSPAVDTSLSVATTVGPTAGPVDAAALSVDEVRQRFMERVVPHTSRGAQLVLKSAAVVDFDGSRITLAVASEEIRQNTDQISQGLKGALDHEFRVPLTVGWVVDPKMTPPATSAPTARTRVKVAPEPSPDFDETSADDHQGPVVTSVAEHLIAEMFPGAEEIS